MKKAEYLQILINRASAVTIKVPITIQNIESKAVVDTGAEVTVISEKLYSLCLKSRPKLKKAKRTLVVSDAGKEMKTQGVAKVQITMRKVTFEWPVYVAPIHDDILLRCGIIDEMNITVSTKKGLYLQDEWIPCDIKRSTSKVARGKIGKSVTVPAGCEFRLTGTCKEIIQDEPNTYLFEVSEEAKDKAPSLLFVRCVVAPKSNKVPVTIINNSKRPVKLKTGLMIGELESVGSVMTTDGSIDMS